MIPVETYCFHSEVDILKEAKTEEENAALGAKLLEQVPQMDGDQWKEARCYYLAARAYRQAEFIRDKSKPFDKYGNAVYSSLINAAEREHLKSMQWLKTCYANGQSIIEPDVGQMEEMKSKITKFIRRVRKYYDDQWKQYLGEKGFKKEGKYWRLTRGRNSRTLGIERKIANHDLSMTIEVGRAKASWDPNYVNGLPYGSTQIHALIEHQPDRLRYIEAKNNLQRWTYREEKVNTMFEMMDKWVMPEMWSNNAKVEGESSGE